MNDRLSVSATTPDTLLEHIARLPIPSSRRRATADALRELYDNAQVHGAAPIALRLERTGDEVRLQVTDAGGTLTPTCFANAQRKADEQRPLSVRTEGPGAGIGLARSLRQADESFLTHIPGAQTQITLIWRAAQGGLSKTP